MQGYDPRVDAAELVRRHGPEKAQQIIAAFMRDRGMSDRNSEIWSGLDVRTAQRGMEPADLSDGMAGAPQTQVGDDATLAGEDGSGRDWGNWKPGDPLPTVGGGGMRSGDDSQRGRGYQKVPGPRTLDGKPTAPGDTIYTQKSIDQYTTRHPNDKVPGRYIPSQRDNDMRRRGMVPIYNEDGSVGYAVAADGASIGSDPQGNPAVNIVPNDFAPPGGVGREGVRMDMANNPNYVPVERDGPSGPQMVYVRSDAGKQKDAERREAGTRRRLMDAAGIDSLGAADLSTDDLRNRAADSRAADLRQRQSAWRAQSMLAGGQPTGGPRGTKAATNALMMMPQEWQNAVLAKSLRPDLDGTTPLTVEANSARNAMRLLNAEVLGQGGMGDMRQQMMEQQNRQKAADYADQEAAKLTGMYKTTLTQQEAERIRRRVEARFPGMGGVVDGLPIEEPSAPAPGGAPAESGAPVPQQPTGRPGPTRPRPGARFPNT